MRMDGWCWNSGHEYLAGSSSGLSYLKENFVQHLFISYVHWIKQSGYPSTDHKLHAPSSNPHFSVLHNRMSRQYIFPILSGLSTKKSWNTSTCFLHLTLSNQQAWVLKSRYSRQSLSRLNSCFFCYVSKSIEYNYDWFNRLGWLTWPASQSPYSWPHSSILQIPLSHTPIGAATSLTGHAG